MFIPKDNERDLEEIPDNVIADLRVIPVQWIDEVLKVALEKDPSGVEIESQNSDVQQKTLY